jgi:hypothetical protein
MSTLKHSQVVLVTMGIFLVGAGVFYGQARASEPYVPWLWMPLFVTAGGACLIFAVRMWSAFWWNTSRILVVMALLMRLYGVVGQVVENGANRSRAAGSGCLYLLGAVGLHYAWTSSFRYWSKRVAASRIDDP